MDIIKYACIVCLFKHFKGNFAACVFYIFTAPQCPTFHSYLEPTKKQNYIFIWNSVSLDHRAFNMSYLARYTEWTGIGVATLSHGQCLLIITQNTVWAETEEFQAENVLCILLKEEHDANQTLCPQFEHCVEFIDSHDSLPSLLHSPLNAIHL